MGSSNPRDDGNRVCEAIEVQPFLGITLAPPRARQTSVRLFCILELLKVPSACRKARGTRNLKGKEVVAAPLDELTHVEINLGS